mmetsp:Transcript_16369/g.16481  ORF Transcript_16369/g.16481 Transcript_16369/m.16481 type:complete len:387 (+) Transcript_16369:94-1254(+)
MSVSPIDCDQLMLRNSSHPFSTQHKVKKERSFSKRSVKTDVSVFSDVSNLSNNTPDSLVDGFKFCLNALPVLSRHLNARKTLDDVVDIKHLTDGSNSQIFAAKVLGSNKGIIIKTVKLNPIDPENTEREFALEMNVLVRMSHPNIVEYMGHGSEDGRSFICLELLKGGSLSSHLQAHKRSNVGGAPFSYERVLEIGISLARALEHIHYKFAEDATVIHRDLKPDNIAFTESGVLKLIDFGLSTCVKRRESCNQTYAMTGRTGSPRYMAPEVLMWMQYTELVDVYSYGLIMWQVATGLVPFGALTTAECKRRIVLNRERPSLQQLTVEGKDASVPAPLVDLMGRCWHWKAGCRPTSIEVVEELTHLLKRCKAEKQKKGCSFWSFMSR